jgi:LCP family protein required for cell wall assembly
VDRPVVRALLSMLVPGAGQLYGGAPRRGLALFGTAAALLLATLALLRWRHDLDLRLLVALLLADAAVLAVRLFAVIDAGRAARRLALAAIVLLTVVPHGAAGYVAVRSYTVLDHVFAHSEPKDVLPAAGIFLRDEPAPEPASSPPPARPLEASTHVLANAAPAQGTWTTILLLGTDEGPGNWGARTDTIIVAALEHGTRRAAVFGIPRNLVGFPLPEQVRGFHDPINGLYGYVRAKPTLFPGARDGGATALKQTVSRLLGLRVDYYALANLRGFADLVDALGGVRIRVKERLHDEVTRPAWGEPKPRIDVFPGREYRMYGRQALAYVRSRKDSSDYTRMARQRCFLSAMADQLDPLRVLRNFDALAGTVERNVRSDVPLDRLAGLVQLATSVDSARTLTVTFGPEYIFARRKGDQFPAPHLGRIRATVRAALLQPERAEASGRAAVAQRSC